MNRAENLARIRRALRKLAIANLRRGDGQPASRDTQEGNPA